MELRGGSKGKKPGSAVAQMLLGKGQKYGLVVWLGGWLVCRPFKNPANSPTAGV